MLYVDSAYTDYVLEDIALGHYCLKINKQTSKVDEKKIQEGCLMERPGWGRMSIHTIMTIQEVNYICDAIKLVSESSEVS